MALWQRIGGHLIVLSDGRRLVDALAAETGMRPAQADAVVREYQRFLYVAAASARPVAPSGLVDTAWHLHLADPASYEDGLCSKVIGRKIEHVTGGPGPRDDPAYAETFRVYREEFGQRPPWRIWPSRRDERRANLAIAVALACVGGAFVAWKGGHPWIAALAGGAAVLAGNVYAVVAPYASASRIAGDRGCVAGADEDHTPRTLAEDRP